MLGVRGQKKEDRIKNTGIRSQHTAVVAVEAMPAKGARIRGAGIQACDYKATSK